VIDREGHAHDLSGHDPPVLDHGHVLDRLHGEDRCLGLF
jgi:hypothetical protein